MKYELVEEKSPHKIGKVSLGEIKTLKHGKCPSYMMRVVEIKEKVFLYCSLCHTAFKPVKI